MKVSLWAYEQLCPKQIFKCVSASLKNVPMIHEPEEQLYLWICEVHYFDPNYFGHSTSPSLSLYIFWMGTQHALQVSQVTEPRVAIASCQLYTKQRLLRKQFEKKTTSLSLRFSLFL